MSVFSTRHNGSRALGFLFFLRLAVVLLGGRASNLIPGRAMDEKLLPSGETWPACGGTLGASILDDDAAATRSRWKEVEAAKGAPVSGSESRPTPGPDHGSRDDLEDKDELENLKRKKDIMSF